ncbi:MAG TPA: VWA domain-containing protein [Bryobacteraceae bacterium]|jgi:Ca-activated chloride channel family protein|nr:VWA domain-containing protein [Bryobacteraceae bacterium]
MEPPAALLSAAAVFSVCLLPAGAQPLKSLERPQFRADTNLILVPVTVTDNRGSIVKGLDAASFTVLDNRQPQPIAAFYSEDAPSSIGIVLDVSGSTKAILNQEKAALHAFLQFSNPEDDFFLVTVSTNPRVVADHVTDPNEIDDLVRWEKAGGGTALCDTVYFALHQARLRHKSRRALLVISDGMDNYSHYSKKDLLREVVESDTQIHTISLNNPPAGLKGLAMAEVQRGLAFMDDLAERSGGLSIRLRSHQDPSAAAARISSAIRNQYVIGYQSPDQGRSEQWHRIQVRVNLQKANVYARSGYQLR